VIEKKVHVRQREELTGITMYSLSEESKEMEMKTGGESKRSLFPGRLIRKNSNSN
jgi:hypothetical protein